MSESETAAFYDSLGKGGMEDWVLQYKTGDDEGIALGLLEEGDRVLDLACGYGRIALALARKGFSVEGIDISPKLIEAAEDDAAGLGLSLRYRVGDMRALPYADASFEKVLCFWNSFTHLLDEGGQLACLRGVHRVLAPGGLCFMVLADPDHEFWRERLAGRKSGVVLVTTFGRPFKSFVHTEDTLRALVAQTAFEAPALELKRMNHSTRLTLRLRKPA